MKKVLIAMAFAGLLAGCSTNQGGGGTSTGMSSGTGNDEFRTGDIRYDPGTGNPHTGGIGRSGSADPTISRGSGVTGGGGTQGGSGGSGGGGGGGGGGS
jgi:hypothetical protein